MISFMTIVILLLVGLAFYWPGWEFALIIVGTFLTIALVLYNIPEPEAPKPLTALEATIKERCSKTYTRYYDCANGVRLDALLELYEAKK